jgi:hypothetical protein
METSTKTLPCYVITNIVAVLSLHLQISLQYLFRGNDRGRGKGTGIPVHAEKEHVGLNLQFLSLILKVAL